MLARLLGAGTTFTHARRGSTTLENRQGHLQSVDRGFSLFWTELLRQRISVVVVGARYRGIDSGRIV